MNCPYLHQRYGHKRTCTDTDIIMANNPDHQGGETMTLSPEDDPSRPEEETKPPNEAESSVGKDGVKTSNQVAKKQGRHDL